MTKRERWFKMRHELRLMRRLFRVRRAEGGMNYRCRCWLSDRIKADVIALGVMGHRAFY